MSDRKQVLTILCKQTKMINKRVKCYRCANILEIYIHVYIYIYIKSKGIYQPQNLMSNGSSRHDDAAQTK